MTLDADGAVVSVSERAEEADEAPPAPAAAAAWGRGPHEVCLGPGTLHDLYQYLFHDISKIGRLLKCMGSREPGWLNCSRACYFLNSGTQAVSCCAGSGLAGPCVAGLWLEARPGGGGRRGGLRARQPRKRPEPGGGRAGRRRAHLHVWAGRRALPAGARHVPKVMG